MWFRSKYLNTHILPRFSTINPANDFIDSQDCQENISATINVIYLYQIPGQVCAHELSVEYYYLFQEDIDH